jgi:transcription antitermination factor NusG
VTNVISPLYVQHTSVIPTLPWYAICIRSSQEKNAELVLAKKGLETYLPTYKEDRRWSDRIVSIDRPIFPGYLFCRFDCSDRLAILNTPGVMSVVGFGAKLAEVPEEEIEAVREILSSGMAARPHRYLIEGQRVRIHRGPLRGLEGRLLRQKGKCTFVVSIELLQRSISVEIDSDSLAAPS